MQNPPLLLLYAKWNAPPNGQGVAFAFSEKKEVILLSFSAIALRSPVSRCSSSSPNNKNRTVQIRNSVTGRDFLRGPRRGNYHDLIFTWNSDFSKMVSVDCNSALLRQIKGQRCKFPLFFRFLHV